MNQRGIIHPQAPCDRTADVFRLIAKLELYEEHLDALGRDWHDVDLWRQASREIKYLVAAAPSLPQLSVAVVELAQCHLQLLSALTTSPAPVPAPEKVADVRQAIDAVRRKGLALVKH